MNELDWIRFIRSRVSDPAGTLGVGDDAAVLPDGLLVTTDAFVEGIHFRSDWASWYRIGRKMAVAAISDIFAMGGEPLWLFATLSSSEGGGAAQELLNGLLSAGVPLMGGDTTSAPKGATTVSLTVIGKSDLPILRSGARPGHRVFVSGPLGGALAGLQSLEKNLGIAPLESRLLDPPSRHDIARAWQAAAAMIDISDGLSSELWHLSESSRVRIIIDSSRIPLFPGIEAAGLDPLRTALESGDEFELLSTAARELAGGLEIGRVEEGEGVFMDGKPLARGGYVHWTGDAK